MECPGCEASLTAVDSDGIEVDVCASCEGLWLDSGELPALLERVEPAEDGDVRVEARPAVDEGEAPSEAGPRRCPRCPEAGLDPFVYLGDSGIELDRCPVCGGLWLDGGELDAIQDKVARSRRQQELDADRFTAEGAMKKSYLHRILEQIGRSLMAVQRGAGIHYHRRY